jgi:predicted ArsR family transcriptional regulator
MDLAAQASGIGALADPTRRSLYEYVAGSREPVSRDGAATALDLAVSTAGFHLDKLVAEGLLETEYRRLTGRTGPGAGRPSKLYRRAEREFAVSLPARSYALVGEILAAAFDRAAGGEPVEAALAGTARAEGLARGTSSREAGAPDDLPAAAAVLADQGYEAHVEQEPDHHVVLENCPFDALAKKHTALVCGLNQHFVQGVVDGLGCAGAEARLEPAAGRCCVQVHQR